MHCGQPLAAPRPEMQQPYPAATGYGAIPAPRARKSWFWAAVLALFVLLAAIVGAGTLLALRARGNADLRAVAHSAAPNLQASLDTMPDDVRTWLKHLEETERRRRQLTTKQITDFQFAAQSAFGADAQDLMNPDSTTDPNHPPGLQKLADEATKAKQEWSDLVDFFNSKRPPTPCISLHDEYDETIRETGGEIGDVIDVLAGGVAQPDDSKRKLEAMRGTSEGSIDAHGEKSDQLLADLCSRYHTAKWFDIKGDIGGGALSAAFGVPGG